ncbi:MAG: hypothetical protein ACJ76F_03645 [Bacteroidia bacterium]
MRFPLILLLFFFFGFTVVDKNVYFPEHLKSTSIARLKDVDSLSYYQCQAVKVQKQQITEANGTVVDLGAKEEYITVTEKFQVIKNKEEYRLKYYTSSETYYPNKKYAYLKLVEKKYWNFQLKKDVLLEKQDVLLLAAYETKLREVTEYDFTVTKINSPQMILNGKKVSTQFMVGGGYLLKNTLSALK